MKKLFKREGDYYEFAEKFEKINEIVIEYHKLRFNERIDYITVEDITTDVVEYSYEAGSGCCRETEWGTMDSRYLLMDEDEFIKSITNEKADAEKKAEQKRLDEEKKRKEEKKKKDYAKYLELKEQFK